MHRRLIVTAAGLVLSAVLTCSPDVRADWGEGALHIQCDTANDAIVVEPFIIWNEQYRLHGVDISAIAGQSRLVIGDSIYYRMRGLPSAVMHESCVTKTRTVNMTYDRRKLLVEEIINGVTRRRQIDLANETHYAWSVYGPIFHLESSKPNEWRACYGRENGETSAITACDPWTLSDVP